MGCVSKNVKNKTRGSNAQWSAIFRTSLYLFLITPLVASCASNQIGPTRPISIDYDVALLWPLAYPQDLTYFINSASRRNELLTARIYIADLEYHTYEARLTREMQDEGLLATAVNLGLTTAATLVPLAHTKTVLAGVATGVAGVDQAFDKEQLLSNTIQALQTQMRADRKAREAEIYAKMFKDSGHNTKTITPIDEYTLPMALSDADAYYQAGTVASSLIGLSKTVANAEQFADRAQAESGPNPRAVLHAQTMAAPIALLGSSRAPLPPTAPPPPPVLPSNVMNNFEFRLSRKPELIRTIQSTVCVKNPDRKLGPVGSETRRNIVEFFEGFGTPRPDIDSTAGGLKVKDREILDEAFDKTTGGKGCIASNFKNPKQVGEFSH